MDRLYFMRNGDDNVVKIGRAGDVEARRGQFMTGNPEDMSVIDVVDADDAQPIETTLHRLNYAKRLRGEFFKLTPAQVEQAGRQAREIRDLYLPTQQKIERLAHAACDVPPLTPNEDHHALRRNVIEKREAKYRADYECDLAEFAYKLAIGTSEGIAGESCWTTYTRYVFDVPGFRQQYAQLYAEFLQPKPQRRFRLLWS
jgi:hypothetical protein